MWYIITAIISGAIGCLLMGVVAGAKQAEEVNKAYVRGLKRGEEAAKQEYYRGLSERKTEIRVVERALSPLFCMKAEYEVDTVDLYVGKELVENHVKSILSETLSKEIMEYAKITQEYIPESGKTRIMATLFVARRD